MVVGDQFDGAKSVHPARRGAMRDVVHRASVATPPVGRFGPPKAGFFCAVALLRFLSDTPHRSAKRA